MVVTSLNDRMLAAYAIEGMARLYHRPPTWPSLDQHMIALCKILSQMTAKIPSFSVFIHVK